jgi:release factor glutamine methyltransferase
MNAPWQMSNTTPNTSPLNVRATLKQGMVQLRAAEVPSYTLAAELLLLDVLGCNRTWLYAHPEESVSAEAAARFSSLVERRSNGEPTQHLTGKQEFWGLEFEVNPDVLIPRPETEHLVEVALDRLALRELRAGRPQTLTGEALYIADVGTGSGCIAVALAKELPGAVFYATDISGSALAVARRNAARHAVADRIHFVKCNLLDKSDFAGSQHVAPVPGGTATNGVTGSRTTEHGSRYLDLVASNPPYIGRREKDTLAREVRDHEPEVALYGGEEGYELYADLVAQSAARLKPGGILVLELGHDSLPAVEPLLDSTHWTNVGVTNDLAGIPRVLAVERL